ncbi:hypothetical protein [Candidatus Uabimicrobium amorphum]|uniref:Uncharacterized protein n=1 Tax=Uabimicrobium amorphum TaxID=2596890 RepID=A0A5S9F322_UABAM|nr:hypothetical protein [Candidatus Uabimicrobium amorphum]BBM83079.1 hypothetical protein UABAM_01429 [Candidatus Uabimicrobium amorphum]
MNKTTTLIIIFLISSCYADIVHLKNGRSLEGNVVNKSDSIVLETVHGYLEIPKDQIREIENSKTVWEIFNERKANLTEDDAEGWFALYLWAKKQRLSREDLLIVLDQTVQADPAHEDAKNEILHLLTIDEEREKKREQKRQLKIEREKKLREEQKIKEEEQRKQLEEQRKVSLERNRVQFGLLPIEYQYNTKTLTDFEDFIDELYLQQHSFPVERFANRGGLNLLFSFIFRKAQQAGFSVNDARALANKYKNIASVGGDRAFQVFDRTFFTIIRLETQRNPNRRRPATNRFQIIRNRGLFLFALRFAAKVASGGSSADGDFNSAYSFLFFKFNRRTGLGLPEYLSYRLATKCAAIIAAGGGVIRFRDAFGFHVRQFRTKRQTIRNAVIPAVREALSEVQHPRRFFRRRRN